MRKTVIVCVLVVVLVCMWSSVACATSWDGYPDTDIGKTNEVIYRQSNGSICLIGSNNRLYYQDGCILSSEMTPVYYYNSSANEWSFLGNNSAHYVYPNLVGFEKILQSNGCNVYDGSGAGAGVYWAPLPFVNPTVSIVLPMDGYTDNSWLYSVWSNTVFYDVQTGFDVENVTVQVTLNGESFGENYYKLNRNITYVQNGDWYNQLHFDVEVPVGTHEIKVTYYYGGEEVASDTVTINRLSGFVDVDGDGKDDRTGQPDASQKPAFDPETEMPEKPEDGDLLAWMRYVGELLSYIFETVVDAIKDFALSIFDGMRTILSIAEPMFSFMKQFFESMPAPMSAAIIALVVVSTALGILKLFRG